MANRIPRARPALAPPDIPPLSAASAVAVGVALAEEEEGSIPLAKAMLPVIVGDAVAIIKVVAEALEDLAAPVSSGSSSSSVELGLGLAEVFSSGSGELVLLGGTVVATTGSIKVLTD
jgi:hypothetical protein